MLMEHLSNLLAIAAVLITISSVCTMVYFAVRWRADKQLLVAFLDAIPDNVFFKDRDSRFIRVSRSMSTYIGLSNPSEAIKRTDADIFSAEHAKQALLDEREIIMTGTPLVGVEELETWPDGRESWVSTTKLPLRNRHGKIIGTMGISHDITNRKRIARELDEYKTRLEELVQIRTAESEQLAIARDLADSANKAKSIFLANMSHELRTPLNAILGYARLMKKDFRLTTRHQDACDIIHHSGEHLLTLITDILDLAKIEAGKLELQKASTGLRAFLNGVADVIRVKAEEKGLEFVVDLPENLPQFIEVDQKRLRQILLNLLSNATKFTDHGRVGLSVRYQPAEEDTVRLRFEITDTGIGIAPQDLNRIFQPFEQVCDGSHSAGGTGLGLAINRQLLQLMGSELQVVSEINIGSYFSFELSTELASAEPGDGATGNQVTGYEGARKRILVADDSSLNRTFLKDLLLPLGFEVAAAEDGKRCIEMTKQTPPDLILMDLRMPVLGGIEAIRVLKSSLNTSAIPIIIISANVHEEDRQRSLSNGACAFLSKPLDFDLLLIELRKALHLRWIEEGAPQVGSPLYDAISEQFEIPDRSEIETLRRLAKSGNMRTVIEQLNYIISQNERYRPFVEKLKHLAESYQSKALLQLVETYTKDSQLI